MCAFSNIASALSCGDIITTNTTLTEDLYCSTGFYALEVRNHNITIDLNGHRISGTTDLQGIIVDGYDNVSIIGNGAISGFWAAINTADTYRLQVKNITFFDVGSGVIVSSGNKASISGSDFINTWSPAVNIKNSVEDKVSSNNSVINNEFYQTRVGVEVCGYGSSDNTIKSNLIWKSQDYGIHLTNTEYNYVYDNTVLESENTAIHINNSSFNTLSSNSLRIGHTGLSLHAQSDGACLSPASVESTNNTFSGNHSIGFTTGIFVGLGSSNDPITRKNTLTGNKIYDNQTGIYFHTDAYNNNAKSNAYTGTIIPIEDLGTGNVY